MSYYTTPGHWHLFSWHARQLLLETLAARIGQLEARR